MERVGIGRAVDAERARRRKVRSCSRIGASRGTRRRPGTRACERARSSVAGAWRLGTPRRGKCGSPRSLRGAASDVASAEAQLSARGGGVAGSTGGLWRANDGAHELRVRSSARASSIDGSRSRTTLAPADGAHAPSSRRRRRQGSREALAARTSGSSIDARLRSSACEVAAIATMTRSSVLFARASAKKQQSLLHQPCSAQQQSWKRQGNDASREAGAIEGREIAFSARSARAGVGRHSAKTSAARAKHRLGNARSFERSNERAFQSAKRIVSDPFAAGSSTRERVVHEHAIDRKRPHFLRAWRARRSRVNAASFRATPGMRTFRARRATTRRRREHARLAT